MLLFDVTKNFDLACDAFLKDKDPELLVFVKRHERRRLVLDNLCDQVLEYERKFGGKVKVGGRNQIIATTAAMFIDACREHHKQKQWSEAEKNRQIAKAEPFDSMKDVIQDTGGKVYTNGVLTEVEKFDPTHNS